MRSRGVLRICLPALAAFALLGAGCGDDDGEETVTEVVTETAPAERETTGTATGSTDPDAEAAIAAVEQVVSHDIYNESYHLRGFRTDPAVSPQFVERVDQVTAEAKAAGAQGLDFDPILCAQNTPSDVIGFEPTIVEDDLVTAVGSFDYGGEPVTVTYTIVFEDSAWKLANSSCLQGD